MDCSSGGEGRRLAQVTGRRAQAHAPTPSPHPSPMQAPHPQLAAKVLQHATPMTDMRTFDSLGLHLSSDMIRKAAAFAVYRGLHMRGVVLLQIRSIVRIVGMHCRLHHHSLRTRRGRWDALHW